MKNFLVKKLTLFGILLLSLTFFIACGSNDDDDEVIESGKTIVETKKEEYTPFKRILELEGNWDSVPEIAKIIAEYIHNTDERKVFNYSGDWVIAGAEESLEDENILGIPIKLNGEKRKVQNIELCNKEYAKQAMATGTHHAPALPCQVAVHSDGTKIFIDILNPQAILLTLFNDIDESYKGGLSTLANNVKDEITNIVTKSLENSDKEFKKVDENFGPVVDSNNLQSNPFVIFEYQDNSGREFTQEDTKKVAEEIISKLGSEENPSTVTGLSEGASWRPARQEPLPIPNAKVVEACSPKYAFMAMEMGVQYATALPCEISVNIKDGDKKTLQIVFLNPEFMFSNLFSDAIAKLSDDEKSQFATLPKIVLDDLKTIVNSAVNQLNTTESYNLSEPTVINK